MKFVEHRLELKDSTLPLLRPCIQCICGLTMAAKGNSNKDQKILEEEATQHAKDCESYKHFKNNSLFLKDMTGEDLKKIFNKPKETTDGGKEEGSSNTVDDSQSGDI